jgi:hypothetical protein
MCSFVICVDYVLVFNMCGLCAHLFFVICAEMALYPLLNPSIDIKHRTKHMEDGEELCMLVTRTPKANQMIHRDWVNKYVSSLFHNFV